MERYYYDQRRLEARRDNGGHGLFHYFFPFFIFIVVGIVGVLGFNLYSYFYGDSQDSTLMYIVEGEAQVKLWGNEDFSKAYSGTKILQGDEIYTVRDSKVVVEFFNGIKVRMSGDTHIVFDEVYRDGSEVDIGLILKKGEAWVNKTDARSTGSNFDMIGEHLVVNASGAVFDFVHEDEELVNVVLGGVAIDVYSENKVTVVDSFEVSDGSGVFVDAEKLGRFWKFQAPNVVEPLSDEFKESNWYVWNLLEDENPTDFEQFIAGSGVIEDEAEDEDEVLEEVLVEDENLIDVGDIVDVEDDVEDVVEDVVDVPSESEVVPVEEVVVEEVLDLGVLTKPIVLKVGDVEWTEAMLSEGVIVTEGPVVLFGKVSGAFDVVVNNYTLNTFEPSTGSESFVYRMSEEYGNLREGENLYEVYALDRGGIRSASAFYKVIYEPSEELEIL